MSPVIYAQLRVGSWAWGRLALVEGTIGANAAIGRGPQDCATNACGRKHLPLSLRAGSTIVRVVMRQVASELCGALHWVLASFR